MNHFEIYKVPRERVAIMRAKLVCVMTVNLMFIVSLGIAHQAQAGTVATKKAANPKVIAKVNSSAKSQPKVAAAVSPVNSAGNRAPASLDPNRAVEIRGQSRTLSMMLVLKNGKENINFVKVRKDYNAEIKATEF
jgi:hypothetical protein